MIAEAFQKFADSIIERRSHIMTAGSCVGTIATFVFTIKANEKANEKEGLEKVKPYILPGAICAGTCALNIINDVQNASEKSALTVAAAAATKLYLDHRKAVDKVVTPEEKTEIAKEMAESRAESVPKKNDLDSVHSGKQLYLDDYSGTWFYTTPKIVDEAEYFLNRNYEVQSYINTIDFYNELYELGVGEFAWVEDDTEFCAYGWSKWSTPRKDICPPEKIEFRHTIDHLCDGTGYILIEMSPEPDYYGL